jgi:hypothetical protein
LLLIPKPSTLGEYMEIEGIDVSLSEVDRAHQRVYVQIGATVWAFGKEHTGRLVVTSRVKPGAHTLDGANYQFPGKVVKVAYGIAARTFRELGKGERARPKARQLNLF